MFDASDGCAGDLAKNNYPFKIGARARGTGMAHPGGDGSDAAYADNAGSRFYGEIDEAMVFNIAIDDSMAAAIYNLF